MTATTGRPAPPLWAATLALAVGGFAIGTSEFATMGVLPEVTGDLGVSVPDGGHLVSAYALGVVVGAPLLAVAAARLPRKALLLALMSVYAAANALSALAPGFGSLVLARFASGLPHGAYFGVAAVVASSLAPPDRRSRAVARVMLGLTVANVLGVPAATRLGQQLGWRSTYWLVAALAVVTVAAVARVVPRLAVLPGASPRRELGALRRPQVWFTLGIGSIGFGGFFAVYSYIAPTLTEHAGMAESRVPVVLAMFGIGMTLGTELGGRLADWSVPRTLWIGLSLTGAMLLVFTVTSAHAVLAAVTCLLLSLCGSLQLPAMQTRLIDAAGDAPSLAAAGMHAAFNAANALGAFLGGVVLAAGYGWGAPAFVGALLSAGGLLVLAAARSAERRGVAPLRVGDPVPAV